MKKIFITIFTMVLFYGFYLISYNNNFINKIVYELIDDYRGLSSDSEGETILNDEIIVQVKLDVDRFSDSTNIDKNDQARYRKAAEEYYTLINDQTFKFLSLSNYKSVYISKYSPYIMYTFDSDKYYNYKSAIANEINNNDFIESACIKDNIVYNKEQINEAMYSAGALDLYQDIDPDYTGYGIKVGIMEPGLVDASAVCFSSGQVTTMPNNSGTVSNHATYMAAYIGGSDGIASDVKIYSANIYGNIVEEIEWLISSGCNIINMSYGEVNPTGRYASSSALCDYYAYEYWVTFVAAVGNEGNGVNYVNNPALGYNVVSVGSGTYAASVDSFSSVLEVDGPPKPTILARGSGVLLGSLMICNTGTSVSCAVTTGIIALLLEKYNAMTYRPDQIIAMLTCSAYQSPYAIFLSCGLNESGGAGLIRYDNFQNQYARYQYITNRNGESGTELKVINVNLTAGTNYKASACWLAYSEGTVDSKKFTDYDIFVIGPDNSIIADATSINSNVELVSFTAETTGTYTIKLMQFGALKTTKDRIILCHGEAPEALLR